MEPKNKNKKKASCVRQCDVKEVEVNGGAELSSLPVQSRATQRGSLQVNPSGRCHVPRRKPKQKCNDFMCYKQSITFIILRKHATTGSCWSM